MTLALAAQVRSLKSAADKCQVRTIRKAGKPYESLPALLLATTKIDLQKGYLFNDIID